MKYFDKKNSNFHFQSSQQKTIFAHLCFTLQVDYESEEEDGDDDGEDKEDQAEEEEEVEENTENTQEESQPEAAGVRMQKKNKRAKKRGREGDETLNQMRVNSVLESNTAIQRYSYDLEEELWCEVSLLVLHKKTLLNFLFFTLD